MLGCSNLEAFLALCDTLVLPIFTLAELFERLIDATGTTNLIHLCLSFGVCERDRPPKWTVPF